MAAMRDQILEAQRQAEAFFFDWRAGRENLQSQYEAAEKKEEFDYRKAIESVEAEFQQNMGVVEAGGPQSLDMLQQVVVEKRNLKLKVLENDYRETRSKMQTLFEKQLLEHTERFSKGIIDKMTVVAKYNAVSQISGPGAVETLLYSLCIDAAQHLVSKSPATLSRPTHNDSILYTTAVR
jgi:hypothetical protein